MRGFDDYLDNYGNPGIDEGDPVPNPPATSTEVDANGYCPHGVYVGGCGIDWMCGKCEDGESNA
jgi:hypothetical protein